MNRYVINVKYLISDTPTSSLMETKFCCDENILDIILRNIMITMKNEIISVNIELLYNSVSECNNKCDDLTVEDFKYMTEDEFNHGKIKRLEDDK